MATSTGSPGTPAEAYRALELRAVNVALAMSYDVVPTDLREELLNGRDVDTVSAEKLLGELKSSCVETLKKCRALMEEMTISKDAASAASAVSAKAAADATSATDPLQGVIDRSRAASKPPTESDQSGDLASLLTPHRLRPRATEGGLEDFLRNRENRLPQEPRSLSECFDDSGKALIALGEFKVSGAQRAGLLSALRLTPSERLQSFSLCPGVNQSGARCKRKLAPTAKLAPCE